MTLRERQILKLETLHLNELSPALVRGAFAQAAKDNHPDTGTLGFSYGYSMKELQHARDVLLDELAVINRACKLCGGMGKVRSTMGWRQCGACAGTGERR